MVKYCLQTITQICLHAAHTSTLQKMLYRTLCANVHNHTNGIDCRLCATNGTVWYEIHIHSLYTEALRDVAKTIPILELILLYDDRYYGSIELMDSHLMRILCKVA